jgi:hypothetical protein
VLAVAVTWEMNRVRFLVGETARDEATEVYIDRNVLNLASNFNLATGHRVTLLVVNHSINIATIYGFKSSADS